MKLKLKFIIILYNSLLSQNETPLIIATKNNNPELAKLLIEHGADPNMYIYNERLDTALTVACTYGYSGVAKVLIANGADIDFMIGGIHYFFKVICKIILLHSLQCITTSRLLSYLYKKVQMLIRQSRKFFFRF